MFDKSNYYRYLKTPIWKKIKLIIKKRDGKVCKFCGSNLKLVVHHLTYEHIFNELEFLSDLITLCENCHNQIHGAKPKNKKQNKKKSHPKPKPISEVFDSMWGYKNDKRKKNNKIFLPKATPKKKKQKTKKLKHGNNDNKNPNLNTAKNNKKLC